MNNPDDKQVILVVDDAPENIKLLEKVLGRKYRVLSATNGQDALNLADEEADILGLILLDIRMPGMSGFEVCESLKASQRTGKIPVIFLTGVNDDEAETKGFALGAVDYITKPFRIEVIMARVGTQLALYDQNRALEDKVRQRTREIVETQDATILSLAVLAEYRNRETGRHALRTRHYVRLLAEHLSEHPRFRPYLDRDTIDLLAKCAPLHDIGKICVPDSVLLNMEKMKPEEEAEFHKHTMYGRDAFIRAEKALTGAGEKAFLEMAKVLAYSHHERWDGTGYPEGLAGEDIPVYGRLMAVADAYDVLVSKRLGKPPFPHQTAVMLMANEKEKQFDPDILDAFMAQEKEFRNIARNLADFEEEKRVLDKEAILAGEELEV